VRKISESNLDEKALTKIDIQRKPFIDVNPLRIVPTPSNILFVVSEKQTELSSL